MLNSLFAGILAQYGMSEGQVETANVETADVETAEVETTDVETTEDENEDDDGEEANEWRDKDLYAQCVLLSVSNAPFEVYEMDTEDDVDTWIDEHKEEVNAMSLEVVLLAQDTFIPCEVARVLAYECYNTRTRLTEYAGGCYYIADESELYHGLDAYELKRRVVETMVIEYENGYQKYFIG